MKEAGTVTSFDGRVGGIKLASGEFVEFSYTDLTYAGPAEAYVHSGNPKHGSIACRIGDRVLFDRQQRGQRCVEIIGPAEV